MPYPPPPARRSHVVLIAAVTAGVVLLVACFGLVGGLFLLRSGQTDTANPSSGAPLFPGGKNSPSPNGQMSESEEAAQRGPQASAYPVTEIDDLNRVCDENVYYPQSPKRSGKAPHPVALLVGDGPSSGTRDHEDFYYYSLGPSKKIKQTWASKDAKVVQVVACLDRVSSGSKIRSCKFDDPKPTTVTLVRTRWRLRVHEVATGRKLLDKVMSGDDQQCPYFALVGADKKIYSKVSDKAVIAALRKFVTK